MKNFEYNGDFFNEFINELIGNSSISGEKEVGIAKLVCDKGIEHLSDKQRFVFLQSIEPFVFEVCGRCQGEIPWEEMIGAEESGWCGWCNQVGNKDN